MRSRQPPHSGIAAWTLLQATITTLAQAADYPTQSIRLIVPFPAGTLTDIQARVIAQKVSQPPNPLVVIDDRGSAEGRLGVEILSRVPADGYTIGMGTIGTLVIAPLIYARLGYDLLNAFAPVSRLAKSPYLVVVYPTVASATLRAFVNQAKSKPDQLNFATDNMFGQLVLELFNGSAGTNTALNCIRGWLPR